MSWKPITQPMPVNTPVLLKQQAEGYEPFVIIGIYVEQYTLEVQEVCDFSDADEICGWIGTNSDLVPIRKNSFSSDLCCPNCGGKTFYPIDENGKIKRL